MPILKTKNDKPPFQEQASFPDLRSSRSTWLSSPPRRSSRPGPARTGRPCCIWSTELVCVTIGDYRL